VATAEPEVTVTAQATPPPSRGSQISPGLLSMVFFIGSEVMLFASFFTAYFFVRFNVADRWPPLNDAGEPFELPVGITGLNTAILVSSSFTVWWGEHRLHKYGDHKAVVRGLIVTIMLGATFLIIQINEYIHIGFTPQDKAFGTTFYCLTGLHGLHVFIGLTLLTFSLIRVAKARDFTYISTTPLTASGIYWHFVDVVWVILFILVYLI
jgi:cytochrome c oxidase subunit III